jgi:hypothetical protein
VTTIIQTERQTDRETDRQAADRSTGRVAAPPVLGSPRRSSGEIGGRRFRVGFDSAWLPSRRRRRRRNELVALVVGWVLAFGLTVYCFVTGAPTHSAAVSACAAANGHGSVAGAAAGAPRPGYFALNVFNATDRDDLAADTAALLKQRGFAVDQVTNDPLRSDLAIPAQVRGAQANMDELREVAAEVPGAQIVTDDRHDSSVDLVLGAGFTALARVQVGC